MKPTIKQTTAFVYRHRFTIANGLMVAALVLRNWSIPAITLPAPAAKPRCQKRIR